jgi:Tfp pilus assembly protein PilO
VNHGTDLKLWGGLAAVAALGLGLGVYPNLTGAQRLASEAKELDARVERSDDGAAALERLRETLAEREAEARARLREIPEDGDVGGFIRGMSQAFERLGLGKPEIKTGRPIDHEDAMGLPMTVELRGDFLRLMGAVTWVENLDRLVRVRKLRFETPTGKGQAPLFGDALEGEITLDVYYAPRLASPLPGSAATADAGEG